MGTHKKNMKVSIINSNHTTIYWSISNEREYTPLVRSTF